MKLEFVGDWSTEDAQAIAQVVKQITHKPLDKSVSMGDMEDAGLSFPELLSTRQKKLIKLLREGVEAALCEGDECDSDPADWEEYVKLKKAEGPSIGQLKHTPRGSFRLNNNRRWERIPDPETALPVIEPVSQQYVQWGAFQFPKTDGEFGTGVYFPVSAAPLGGLRLRLSLAIAPEEMISDEEFRDLEDDLTLDTDLILDSKGIKAVSRTEGDRITLLCIRDVGDINILGVIGGSGAVPQGTPAFNLVRVAEVDGRLMADVEMVEAASLSKAASTSRRATFHSNTFLNGTPLERSHGPALNRTVIKEAIARCKADGLSFDDIEVCLVQGKPDFLPGMVRAYCLPSDGRICLAPHDPSSAIAFQVKEWTERMKACVSAGVVSATDALDVVQRVASLDENWWIESLIKRYYGAVKCDRAWGVLNGGNPPAQYMALLVARGAKHWGDRRTVAECMAEDFRIAHDPAGLPNSITCEWDLMVPGLARAAQQILLSALSN